MSGPTRRTALRIGGSALATGLFAGCIGDSSSGNAGDGKTPTNATDSIEPTSGGDITGDRATLDQTTRSAPDPTGTPGTPVVSAIDTSGCPSASDGTFETSNGERSDVRPGRRAIVEFDRARNRITVHGTVITSDCERISSTSVTCADGTDTVELVIATESTIATGGPTVVACGGYPLEYRAVVEFDGSLPETVVVTYRWPDGEPAFSTTASGFGDPRTTEHVPANTPGASYETVTKPVVRYGELPPAVQREVKSTISTGAYTVRGNLLLDDVIDPGTTTVKYRGIEYRPVVSVADVRQDDGTNRARYTLELRPVYQSETTTATGN